mmetsp:Transcript_12774/g.40063  ORF Transcript_12774/g.40063 Transcript_12774/m.40063 type:complete len:323 (-) Transcript_12774:268-1236(-)
MHQRGRALHGLHGVWRHCFHHQHGQRPRDAEVISSQWHSLPGVAANHLPQPRAEILEVCCQGQDGHDLRADGNGEGGLATQLLVQSFGVLAGAFADCHAPQVLVIAVSDALPSDGVRVDVQDAEALHFLRCEAVWVILFVSQPKLLQSGVHRGLEVPLPSLVLWAEPIEDALGCGGVLVVVTCVDRRSEEVVSSGDRMDVACHVQVELLHGHALRVTTTRRTTLDAEGRAHGGLPDARQHLLAEVGPQRLGEAHGCRGFPLPQGRRVDPDHDDVVTIRLVLQAVIDAQAELALVWPVGVHVFITEAESLCEHLLDRCQLHGL